jgi:hypothetical protein
MRRSGLEKSGDVGPFEAGYKLCVRDFSELVKSWREIVFGVQLQWPVSEQVAIEHELGGHHECFTCYTDNEFDRRSRF